MTSAAVIFQIIIDAIKDGRIAGTIPKEVSGRFIFFFSYIIGFEKRGGSLSSSSASSNLESASIIIDTIVATHS